MCFSFFRDFNNRAKDKQFHSYSDFLYTDNYNHVLYFQCFIEIRQVFQIFHNYGNALLYLDNQISVVIF